MRIVYAVRWIESEFGTRSEGYKIYTDEENCREHTILKSSQGTYEGGGGYFGPERPLTYVEVPWDCLEADVQAALEPVQGELLDVPQHAHSSNHWTPKFKSDPVAIQ